VPVDDYYALLGVSPDAGTDEIKAAYRAKRVALEGGEQRAEAALVNRAWNVLSDPYQRGRYDEQLAQARLDDLDGHDDGEAAAADAAPARRRRLFDPSPPRDRAPRAPRALPTRTLELPSEVEPAERRARVLAMVFDLTVVVAIGIGSMLVGQAVLRDRFPDEIDRSEEISDRIAELDDDADTAADRASDLEADAARAESDGDTSRAADLRDDAAAATREETRLRDEIETLDEEQADIASEVQPTYILFNYGIPVALGVLYLVPMSALTGQTLGKRLRGVRVVRVDGRPLGWTGALVRYGAPAFVTVGFAFLLGPLALLLVLFGVLAWMRNPNEQGLHDRLAKTVVVGA
jgi:curved DNA-binding protein CbpA